MLASYAHTNRLEYPLKVEHGDRPDFVLRTPTKEIGIEITEAISSHQAAIDAYRESKRVQGPFPIKRHKPGDEQLRGKELQQASTNGEFGAPWSGDSVEREWSEAMQSCVSVKVKKSKNRGFTTYKQNWLLIYDNWSFPALEEKEALRMLSANLKTDSKGPFQIILIERPRRFLELGPGRNRMIEIIDIWGGA